MNSQDFQKTRLPDTPGVYLFKKGKTVLYVGKATSLKDRVRSYFAKDLIATRGPLLVDMVFQAQKIEHIATDSVIEALILEANLIKKYQPKYNTKEKDDKSYNYVIITKEDFPRVLIERGKNIDFKKKTVQDVQLTSIHGPFTHGTQLKEALKIIRKIFPFRDTCKLGQERGCFNYQIGLCSGTCIGVVSKAEYAKMIKNIELFFSGKKTSILKSFEKDMRLFAKKHEFEKAEAVKRKIFALNHIQDIALIKNEHITTNSSKLTAFRIEAYDIAHISGTNTVGVFVVIENGEVNKSQYRKFKIYNSVQNDVAGLREMLSRRLKHTEWRLPDIIVVDGSMPQKHAAEKILQEHKLQIPVIAVTKDERHRPKTLQGNESLIRMHQKSILLANGEAHRFALSYHRAKRGKIV